MPADTAGGYPIDSVAKISMRGLALDWFDYIFRERKTCDPEGQDKLPVMGSNEWRHVSSRTGSTTIR